jgi:CRISPR-associated protein Csy3
MFLLFPPILTTLIKGSSMTIMTVKKLPGVLAFRRGHIVSDAEMFSRLPDDTEEPIAVIRHGIRGTQNVNDGKGNEDQKKAATNSSRDVSNIQMTETAKLHPQATALVVRFSLSMLDLDITLDSCTAADKTEGRNMRASVGDFVARAKKSNGIYNVALRYARNIANGRWLWRNRTIASQIEVIVTRRDQSVLAVFDALQVPFHHFDNPSEQEHALARELAAQMRGESMDGLTVAAIIAPRIGGNIEVYPSQNYVERKPKGFSRPLYKIGHPEPLDKNSVQDSRFMGSAALRDQKIFNAIRTIDTWYPSFEESGFPIPVEPLGASLAQQEFYRQGKNSSFELFKRLVQIDPDSDEGMFCIAALDRGGVYGESDKADKAEKAEEAA